MKKVVDYIKDKSYYFLGATIFIIVLLIIINSCSSKSGGNSYESMESKMVEAAKLYYQKYPKRLPKENSDTVKITSGTLIDSELLKELKDPKKSDNYCSGYVEVTKIDDDYSYLPFLTCPGSYEPKYLVDVVRNSKLDEYGNGVYTIDKELVYRGDIVNNFVSFSNMLWRIVSVDNLNDIKLVLANKSEEYYYWDKKYNSDSQSNDGINSDYFHSNIRKELYNFYDKNISTNDKGKIVSKTICVGALFDEEEFNREKECSIVKDNEKVMLLNAYDYKNASLDSNCSRLDSRECTNYNYLSDSDYINTWLLTVDAKKTYKVYNLNHTLSNTSASSEKRINPVIYLSGKVLINGGKGTQENPYIIK